MCVSTSVSSPHFSLLVKTGLKGYREALQQVSFASEGLRLKMRDTTVCGRKPGVSSTIALGRERRGGAFFGKTDLCWPFLDSEVKCLKIIIPLTGFETLTHGGKIQS